jgi:DNA-directed RNA polymerase I subunit RPA12
MRHLGIYIINQILDTSIKTVVTKTKESAFPSELRLKRSKIQTIERSDRMNEATIQQTCPECGRKEMRYYTVQLRSADEGTTVFYNCECGYK